MVPALADERKSPRCPTLLQRSAAAETQARLGDLKEQGLGLADPARRIEKYITTPLLCHINITSHTTNETMHAQIEISCVDVQCDSYLTLDLHTTQILLY